MFNIQKFDDNQRFKLGLMKYSNLADHHPARSRKCGRMFQSKFNFKDVKFLSELEMFTELKERTLLELEFLIVKK